MNLKPILKISFSLTILTILICSKPAIAWHDKTHLSIARAAGYDSWYNAVGADIAKLKARKKEGPNHYVNNPRGTVISGSDVLRQVKYYDNVNNSDGRLYGSIVKSIRNYKKAKRTGKYPEYHLDYCAHYIGDLSMPFHNIEYKGFAKKNHIKLDGIVEAEIFDNFNKIKIYKIVIKSEKDLADEIAKIANKAIWLGYKLVDEKRLLTKEETYEQLSQSASLLKAVLIYLGKIK